MKMPVIQTKLLDKTTGMITTIQTKWKIEDKISNFNFEQRKINNHPIEAFERANKIRVIENISHF